MSFMKKMNPYLQLVFRGLDVPFVICCCLKLRSLRLRDPPKCSLGQIWALQGRLNGRSGPVTSVVFSFPD